MVPFGVVHDPWWDVSTVIAWTIYLSETGQLFARESTVNNLTSKTPMWVLFYSVITGYIPFNIMEHVGHYGLLTR